MIVYYSLKNEGANFDFIIFLFHWAQEVCGHQASLYVK